MSLNEYQSITESELPEIGSDLRIECHFFPSEIEQRSVTYLGQREKDFHSEPEAVHRFLVHHENYKKVYKARIKNILYNPDTNTLLLQEDLMVIEDPEFDTTEDLLRVTYKKSA